MDTINIICRANKDDIFKIREKYYEINLTDKKKLNYTFWKNKNLLKLPSFFSYEAIDFLSISLFVYYADRKIKRDNFPDAWTRNITLYIPVLSDKWTSNKHLLESILSFLSGDLWTIHFRKREENEIEQELKKTVAISTTKIKPNAFCFLSGGLDSFIGVIDLLNEKKEMAFISHYGGGKGVKNFQDLVSNVLKGKYQINDELFFSFHASAKKCTEDTTRTRSLIFFSHAIILASAFNDIRNYDIYVPENGFISLNIPLTNSRLGSSSTRTTHPYLISLLNELLNNLDLNGKLVNPYQFKTKGEMIISCKDKSFLENNISLTMSCSHPDQGRYNKEKTATHCGNCYPCVIRRAALKKAGIIDPTIYRDKNFSEGKSSQLNLNTYNLAINKHNDNIMKNMLKIQMSGNISENHEKYASIYDRGMKELKALIDEYV